MGEKGGTKTTPSDNHRRSQLSTKELGLVSETPLTKLLGGTIHYCQKGEGRHHTTNLTEPGNRRGGT